MTSQSSTGVSPHDGTRQPTEVAPVEPLAGWIGSCQCPVANCPHTLAHAEQWDDEVGEMVKEDLRPLCAHCGLSYHRYSSDDPEHRWSPTACVNSLRAEVDRLTVERDSLRAENLQLHAAFDAAESDVSYVCDKYKQSPDEDDVCDLCGYPRVEHA